MPQIIGSHSPPRCWSVLKSCLQMEICASRDSPNPSPSQGLHVKVVVLAAFSLWPMVHFLHWSCRGRTQRTVGVAISGLVLPSIAHRPLRGGHFLNCSSLFPNDSNRCQADVKLASMTTLWFRYHTLLDSPRHLYFRGQLLPRATSLANSQLRWCQFLAQHPSVNLTSLLGKD